MITKQEIINYLKDNNDSKKRLTMAKFLSLSDRPCGCNTIVTKFGSWNNALKESGIPVNRTPTKLKVWLTCDQCSKKFLRSHYHISDDQDTYFCDKNCSNKALSKRPRPKNRKHHVFCADCGKPILSNRKFCKRCFNAKSISNKKISELVNERNRIPSSKYSSIRCHARSVLKGEPQCCQYCGYNKHVHTCHIKPISDFPKTAYVRDVNHRSNLLALCPNHHWEFDHGILSLDEILNVSRV